jgi:Phosphate-induced protein 1 conserved region
MFGKYLAIGLALFASVTFTEVFAHTLQPHEASELRPTGRGTGERDPDKDAAVKNRAARVATGSNGIAYHNGPVMTSAAGVNVYYIWYGNWANYSATQSILRNFASSLSFSPLFNTNTSYYDANKLKVVNRVTLSATEYVDNYSQGAALTDAGVARVVAGAIGTGIPDANGVYFVLTSPDVQETSGFGTQYCGWHTYTTIANKRVKYSFVGNPVLIAPYGCGVRNPSPNGDGGADAMASVIFHELSETVTDPQLNAWYDTRGYENADKCAWTFGPTFSAPNGATANVLLGANYYLIQQNWVNAGGGYCSVKY